MRRIIAVASLLILAISVSACSSPSSPAATVTQIGQREAATPKRVTLRSEIVSASTVPEDVVRKYLEASNQGNGTVMNALLGKDGSALNRDVPSATPSIRDIKVYPATGKNPAAAAEVRAELRVLDANNYFALEPGPAALRFVLLRDDDGLWYVMSISNDQK